MAFTMEKRIHARLPPTGQYYEAGFAVSEVTPELTLDFLHYRADSLPHQNGLSAL